MVKLIVNWVILAASVAYGLWTLGKLVSVFFVLGDNDTGLAMLCFFVFGVAPLPTALLALRWRKIGAGIFATIAVVIAVGFVDDDMYMAARNGTSLKPQQEMASLILPVVPLLLFAAFYLITAALRWPKISGTGRLPS